MLDFDFRWKVIPGGKPLRYFYVDEAGTSAPEPVSVVVAIIVDADNDYVRVEKELAARLDAVPKHFQPGFVSHAKSIWGNPKYRDGWSLDERLAFLKGIASIPYKLGVPMAMGFVNRNMGLPAGDVAMPEETYHHRIAFALCVAGADEFLRKFGKSNEVATLVAEDIPARKAEFRAVIKKMRSTPYVFPEQDGAPAHAHEITRVRDTVHFVEKADGPFLQIADACAFGLRRFLGKQSHGKDLFDAIVGDDLKGHMPDEFNHGQGCWTFGRMKVKRERPKFSYGPQTVTYQFALDEKGDPKA
jgi:hypothetical protein